MKCKNCNNSVGTKKIFCDYKCKEEFAKKNKELYMEEDYKRKGLIIRYTWRTCLGPRCMGIKKFRSEGTHHRICKICESANLSMKGNLYL